MKTCHTKLLTLGGAYLSGVTRAHVALSTTSPGSSVCCHDKVHIAWVVADWSGGGELVWVEVQDVSRSNIAVGRFDLFQYGRSVREPSAALAVLDPVPKMLQRVHSVIHCWDHGPFKTPGVRRVCCSNCLDTHLLMLSVRCDGDPEFTHNNICCPCCLPVVVVEEYIFAWSNPPSHPGKARPRVARV